jgi:transitional endoplasmic reticulum ATPase
MEETLEEIEQHLLRNPFDSAKRLSYAAALEERGRFEDAIEQSKLLLAQSSFPAECHPRIGRCLMRLGQPAEAEKHFAAYPDDESDEADEGQIDEFEEFQKEAFAEVSSGEAPRPAETTVEVFKPERDPVHFADIAGMAELKKTLRLKIVEPFLHPGIFAKFNKKAGGGVLLYGPPGCGKTMMARAIATECKATFFSVGISDVLNRWIGASEKNLELIFKQAREHKPAVLFFDELDALAYSRSKAVSEHTRSVVNEFLHQLDGINTVNDQLLVLAATNMPWDIDPAMKRFGRFSRMVFVPPPDEEARVEIFRLKLLGAPVETIDYSAFAKQTAHFSGADIEGVVEQAKEYALGDYIERGKERSISAKDLQVACNQIVPSTKEWLQTARNIIKFGGGGEGYREVEQYLKSTKFL